MSILVYTNEPDDLIAAIKSKIDQKANLEGSIHTWAYDSSGDFTHTADQWEGKAWMRSFPLGDHLRFGIVGRKGITMTKLVYGVYHGRFLEMLLTHFDDRFSSASITAIGNNFDLYKAAEP